MYSDRLWGPASAVGGAAVVVTDRFIGAAVFDAARERSFKRSVRSGD
jgi:hypothetical protein